MKIQHIEILVLAAQEGEQDALAGDAIVGAAPSSRESA